VPSFLTDTAPRFDGETGRFIDVFVTYDRKQLIGSINKSPTVRLGLTRIYRHIARAEGRMGNFDKAIAYLNRGLELDPNNSDCLNKFAWYLATGPDSRYWDAERAVKLARKAVQLSPQHSGFRYTLGVAEYRAGNWETAIEHLEEVFQMEGKITSYSSFFLAMAHWRRRYEDAARTWHEKAVDWMDRNDPDNEELLRFRAEASELLGMRKPAQGREDDQPGETGIDKSETVEKDDADKSSSDAPDPNS